MEENPLQKVVSSSRNIRYAIMIVSVYGTIQGLTLAWEKYKVSWISHDAVMVVFFVSFVFAFMLEYALVQTETGIGYTKKGTKVRRAIVWLWGFYAFINFLTMSANILVRADNVVISSPSLESAVAVRESFKKSYDELENEYDAKLKMLTKYRSGAAQKELKEAFEKRKGAQIAALEKELHEKVSAVEKARDRDIAIYRSRDYDGDAKIRANVRWARTKAKRKIAKLKAAYSTKMEAVRAKRADTSALKAEITRLERSVNTLQATKLSVVKQLQAANADVEKLETRLKAERESDLLRNKFYTALFAAGVVLMNIFMSFQVGRVQEWVDVQSGVKKPEAVEAVSPVRAAEVKEESPAVKVVQADNSGTKDEDVLNMIAMHLARTGKMPTYNDYMKIMGTNSRQIVAEFVKRNAKYIRAGNVPGEALRELAGKYNDAKEVA